MRERARRRGAPRAARSAPPAQLVPARALLGRRRHRLRHQPRRLLDAGVRVRRPVRRRRAARVLRRRHEQLPAQPHWTFKATDGRVTFQAPRFLIVSLIALGFNLLVLELLVGVAGVHKVAGQAAAILAATPVNFIGNKLWSFRLGHGRAEPRARVRRRVSERGAALLCARARVAPAGRPQRCRAQPGVSSSVRRSSRARRRRRGRRRGHDAVRARGDRDRGPLAEAPSASWTKHEHYRREAFTKRPAPLAGQLLRGPTTRSRRSIVDERTREAVEVWTGPQVAWEMARGLPGAFGRKVNAPYVWIPLMVAFIVPFIDSAPAVAPAAPRPAGAARVLALAPLLQPRRDLHVGAARLPGARLPARADAAVRVRARGSRASRSRCGRSFRSPISRWRWSSWSGFAVGLNLTQLERDRRRLLGRDRRRPAHSRRGRSTATSRDDNAVRRHVRAGQLLRVRAVRARSSRGRGEWDDLPAAHAAALFFDLATMLGLLLVGRRLRPGRAGRELGIVLAYAWAAFPYTVFVLNSNANDSLVAMLLVYSFLFLQSSRMRGATARARGRGQVRAARARPAATSATRGARKTALRFVASFAVVTVLVAAAAWCSDRRPRRSSGIARSGSSSAATRRSASGGRSRGSSSAAGRRRRCWRSGSRSLVAFVPRRKSPLQAGGARRGGADRARRSRSTHWFYLYIVWFLPLVLIALFGREQLEDGEDPPSGGGQHDELDRAREPASPDSTRQPITHGSSSSEVSNLTGSCGDEALQRLLLACTPMTPPRAPVMPTSVT